MMFFHIIYLGIAINIMRTNPSENYNSFTI